MIFNEIQINDKTENTLQQMIVIFCKTLTYFTSNFDLFELLF